MKRRHLARAVMSLLLLMAGIRLLPRMEAAQLLSLVPSGAPLLAPLEAAVGADPDSAAAHFRLGLRYRDLLAARDLERALHHLERAVALNPHDWRAWQELAAAQEVAGDAAAAEGSYRAAMARNPRQPGYSWRLANLYLRRGELERALPAFGRAVAGQSRYAAPAWALLRGSGATPAQIEAHWPQEPGARQLLDRLVARDRAARGAAGSGW